MAKTKKQNDSNKIEKGFLSLKQAKARNGFDFSKPYTLADGIELIKKVTTSKFDESIDVAINLSIDAKQTDQNVRGVVTLPNGIGKKVIVAVFARDKKADEAKKAGADIIGAEELIESVAKGVINFDRCIATPDMMPLLGKVAKVLGPKGLMPNPKLGSVSDDVATAVKNAKSGQVEFRADKGGIVHACVGKKSFDAQKISENIKFLVDALNKAKPNGVKGNFIKKVTLTSTMGPGIRIEAGSVAA
jgi:large subunit ribosomal protein L1